PTPAPAVAPVVGRPPTTHKRPRRPIRSRRTPPPRGGKHRHLPPPRRPGRPETRSGVPHTRAGPLWRGARLQPGGPRPNGVRIRPLRTGRERPTTAGPLRPGRWRVFRTPFV